MATTTLELESQDERVTAGVGETPAVPPRELRRSPRIAIVGAGISGLAMAVKLQAAGYHRFTVFELSDGPGGTWRDNSYPGCEVDIPSHAYSFSFLKYDWTRNYGRQPELLRYLEDVTDHFGLRAHCRFNTKVERAIWDTNEQNYRVETTAGEVLHFDIVVSCLGLLNHPRYPDWPGLDEFEGPKFHSARWEHQHDLRGKRVAIVGTGSSSAQIVPAIAPEVGHLYVYQREPGWVFPKDDREFTQRERERFTRYPVLQELARFQAIWKRQTPSRLRTVHYAESSENRAMREDLAQWIRTEVDNQDTARALTPDYPVGCKRGVIAGTFYRTFNRANVDLVSNAVARVTRNSVVDATGAEREVDVLIMATGFQPTQMLASLEVVGPDGHTIHERWGTSASAFLGLSVPGIPNFFILYGPNTNGGVSIMQNAERQADAVVVALRRMERRRGRVIETRPLAYKAFVRWCDWANSRWTAHSSEHCTNYYHAADGRNVTQWPGTSRTYWAMSKTIWPLGIKIGSSGDVDVPTESII